MEFGHYKGVWSWCVRDQQGHIRAAEQADIALPHASVGKVLLLFEVARQIHAGQLHADQVIDRPRSVADSGLWQHMAAPTMRVDDACVLVAGVSDNLATNALIAQVGLAAVAEMRRTHLADLESLELCDVVRDHRAPDHPKDLAVGSTTDWSALMHRLATEAAISPAVSAQVRAWLALNVDHSMVLQPLGLDPLVADEHTCFHKTGWDAHVRADAGVVTLGGQRFAYSACVSPVDDAPEAMNLLRSIVEHMR